MGLGLVDFMLHVLTPPLKLMMVKQQQFANQELMAWPRQAFCENVRKLEFTGNMGKTNDLAVISIMNKVTIHLNMFCPFMKDWILSDTDGTSIVCMKRGSRSLREAQICK